MPHFCTGNEPPLQGEPSTEEVLVQVGGEYPLLVGEEVPLPVVTTEPTQATVPEPVQAPESRQLDLPPVAGDAIDLAA
jgi:hypothetical protein